MWIILVHSHYTFFISCNYHQLSIREEEIGTCDTDATDIFRK